MITKIARAVVCFSAGVIGMYILNYCIIEPVIIRDPCSWHSEKTTTLFDTFYSMPASEGYHPCPTRFNNMLTLGLGVYAGSKVYTRLDKFNTWLKE